MIRKDTIEGIFRDQSPSNTHIHTQVDITDSDFRERTTTPGYTIRDRFINVSDIDPNRNTTYRGLAERIVELNSDGTFTGPEYLYNPNLLTIINDIQERLQIAGIRPPDENNHLQELVEEFETPSLTERIFREFYPLIPYGEGLFRNTAPHHIFHEFSQPTAAQIDNSFIPDSQANWSLNNAISNVLRHYRPETSDLNITYTTPSFGNIRRNPITRQVPPDFHASILDLRVARYNLIRNLSTYISTVELDIDEARFLGEIFSPANLKGNLFNRTLNVPKHLTSFKKANPDIEIQPSITASTPLPPSKRITSQLHAYLPPNQAIATSSISDQYVETYFTAPLASSDFNFYRYSLYLRNLFIRSLLELPEIISSPRGLNIEKRSLALITVIKNLRTALLYKPFIEYEEQVLSHSRPFETLIEDTAFYFANYLLLHIELNQYTRLLKAIIQFSNLENKEDLTI